MGKQVEAHDEVEMPIKQHYTENDKSAKELQISTDGLILVDQLKEFIEGTIRSKIEGSSRSSFTYSKPYTPRIDSLKMPMGYQPPKFQQFDGRGNPKQHVAHFVENATMQGHMICQHGRAYKFSSMKEEPVVDYINRWRNLSFNCKDRLSEVSAIEMCIQGMNWELCYILQAIKPNTFEELATRAHGIEMSFNCKEDEYSVDPNDDDGDDGDATP
ncbi:hypothetical protein Sango_1735000 [Sesamum angolense]|uniref:Retrotransposon gag protein n=1 Tax=Sesamum angolense TaxID=2727404 RepID=A0AAE2BS56_9LAMI|nr:hypothetical protein Sango_1735000 [Sesamum angolense]